MIIIDEKKLATLSKRERFYWNVLRTSGKAGVLYIESEPGFAKSSMARAICEKLGGLYLDVRLSQADETDLKFPYLREVENGRKVTAFTVPDWADMANRAKELKYAFALVHFEELNRAMQNIQNASLGIMLERTIGHEFKFEEHVAMMSSGNLGDEDGTVTEEFDRALNSRIIRKRHTLTGPEWCEQFANQHVIPHIVNFHKSTNWAYFYKAEDTCPSIASPRTWTFLSNYIKETYGENSNPSEWLEDIIENGMSFVGPTITKFTKFIESQSKFGAKDVLERFDEIKSEVEKLKGTSRSRLDEIMNEIMQKHLKDYSKKNLDNLAKFFDFIDDDKLASYFLKELEELDSEDFLDNELVKGFMKKFTKFADIMEKHMS